MKKTTSILCFALALAGIHTAANAQVKFKVSRTNADSYTVSMIPEQTLIGNRGMTGTMQVTMRTDASDGFALGQITSLQPGVQWDRGTLNKSPDGARSFDYLSIALQSMGTKGLTYEVGKEVPLFTVKNAGNPAADLQLIDNDKDPLVLAKQNVFNVRNHISVLGFGHRNAYTGNTIDELGGNSQVGLQQVFPNPASQRITVTYVNYQKALEGEVVLKLAETGSGRALLQQKEAMQLGTNTAEMTVETLSAGSYVLYLERQGIRVGSGLKVVVVR